MNHKDENKTKITNNKRFFELNKNFCLQINLGEQLEESVNEIHRYRTNIRTNNHFPRPSSDFELIHINSSSSLADDDYYESFLNNIQKENTDNKNLKSRTSKPQTQKTPKTKSKLLLDKVNVTSIVKVKVPQSTKNESTFLNNRKKNMLTQLPSIHEEKLSHPSSAVIEHRQDFFNKEERKSLFKEQNKNIQTYSVKKEESFSIEKQKLNHNEELRKSNGSVQQVIIMKNSVNISKTKKLGQSLFLSNCSNDNIQNHIKKFSVSPINLSRNSKEQILQRMTFHRKGKKSSSDKKLNNNIDNINKPISKMETNNNAFSMTKSKKKTMFCCIPIS